MPKGGPGRITLGALTWTATHHCAGQRPPMSTRNIRMALPSGEGPQDVQFRAPAKRPTDRQPIPDKATRGLPGLLPCSISERLVAPSQLLFFREPPDAFFVGGDPLFDLTTHTADLKEAAEVGQEVQ
jgi:hypothetical protein